MIPIGRGRRLEQEAGDDPVAMLIACHGRIRHFTELARRLARAEAPAQQIAEAAANCVRYFDVALPLHSADEDLSVRPRLERAAARTDANAGLRQALASMSEEHTVIETLLREDLVPTWQVVAAEPGRLPVLAEALARGADRLASLFERHLPPEETLIFPALQAALSPPERAVMATEMRARRRPRT